MTSQCTRFASQQKSYEATAKVPFASMNPTTACHVCVGRSELRSPTRSWQRTGRIVNFQNCGTPPVLHRGKILRSDREVSAREHESNHCLPVGADRFLRLGRPRDHGDGLGNREFPELWRTTRHRIAAKSCEATAKFRGLREVTQLLLYFTFAVVAHLILATLQAARIIRPSRKFCRRIVDG